MIKKEKKIRAKFAKIKKSDLKLNFTTKYNQSGPKKNPSGHPLQLQFISPFYGYG